MWDDTVYRTQENFVQAVQWTGDNYRAILSFVQRVASPVYIDVRDQDLRFFGPAENRRLTIGDWVIRTVQGDLTWCPISLFPLAFTSTGAETNA
jgi:hypothetical protein